MTRYDYSRTCTAAPLHIRLDSAIIGQINATAVTSQNGGGATSCCGDSNNSIETPSNRSSHFHPRPTAHSTDDGALCSRRYHQAVVTQVPLVATASSTKSTILNALFFYRLRLLRYHLGCESSWQDKLSSKDFPSHQNNYRRCTNSMAE